MLDSLNEYILAIYNLHKAPYGLLVVTLMAMIGISIGLFIELLLRLLGSNRE